MNDGRVLALRVESVGALGLGIHTQRGGAEHEQRGGDRNGHLFHQSVSTVVKIPNLNNQSEDAAGRRRLLYAAIKASRAVTSLSARRAPATVRTANPVPSRGTVPPHSTARRLVNHRRVLRLAVDRTRTLRLRLGGQCHGSKH